MTEHWRYIIFFKPYGVVSAFTDTDGNTTLKNYIPIPDVYAAGRLDMDSEGLLFLSNDGPLMHQLTDPKYEHQKTYLVQVEGIVTQDALEKLESGVEVKGRMTRRSQAMVIPEPDLPPRIRPVTPHGPTSWLRIVLREGMKRQIRHMTAAVGYPTLRLLRVALGPLSLGALQPGEWRELALNEVQLLRQSLKRKRANVERTPEASSGNIPGSRYRSGAPRSPNRGIHRNGAGGPKRK